MTQIDLDRYATKGEAKVARRLIRNALRIGCAVSVNDGEEWTVKNSFKFDDIIAALASTGEDTVRVSLLDAPDGNKSVARFWLIYGNDENGDELIADCTANALADELCALANPN